MYRADPMLIGVIVFWIVLGLAVFFVATRGGPRGARDALHNESKASDRIVLGIVVVAFAFGLVVPALVLAHNGADQAKVAVGGVQLTAEEQHGRVLFLSPAAAVTRCLRPTRSGASDRISTRASDRRYRPKQGAERLCSTRSPKAVPVAAGRCRRNFTKARKLKRWPISWRPSPDISRRLHC